MAAETASKRRSSRNSAIELLCLISMLMIVGHHYVRGGAVGEFGNWIASQSISLSKFVYQFIYMRGGWIDDCVFFTISVWFLIDRKQTLRGCFRRVWLMERQLLFCSLTLLVVTYVLQKIDYFDVSLLPLSVYSLFPLSFNLWWCPTSYALFLLFLPFLLKGGDTLGKRMHRMLAIGVLVIWGFLGMIPHVQFNLHTGTVFVFMYWFVLLTYYKWYMKRISAKTAIILMPSGLIIYLIYWAGANIIYTVTHSFLFLQNFPYDHWFVASMLIGFDLFSLAEMREWHSSFVNYLAESAFLVYIIYTTIPSIWERFVSIQDVFTSSHPLLFGACAILGIFFVCLFLDCIRQFLFKVTVDRHEGRWSDRPWEFAEARIVRRGKHVGQRSFPPCEKAALPLLRSFVRKCIWGTGYRPRYTMSPA